MQNKIILILFIILFGIFGGGYFFMTRGSVLQNKEMNTFDQTKKTNTINSTSTTGISIATGTGQISPETETTRGTLYTGVKEPGDSIIIDVAVLKEKGFVVIYENTFEPTGEILGASSFLLAGEYTRIPVKLSRVTAEGETFTAMLHKDNGDSVFNIVDDQPFRDAKGNGVFTNIRIQSLTPTNTIQN